MPATLLTLEIGLWRQVRMTFDTDLVDEVVLCDCCSREAAANVHKRWQPTLHQRIRLQSQVFTDYATGKQAS